MHIAEGILPLVQAAAWAGVALPFVVDGGVRLRRSLSASSPDERALLGMGGALIFAVTLFPIPVPTVGVTSHMCATPLAALLLGPRRIVVPVAISLLLQALLFAHGGLTSLGANIVTLGVFGPLLGVALFRGLRLLRVSPAFAVGIACCVADLGVYALDSVMMGLALQGERSFGYWCATVALGFAPAQLPLAFLEGVLSAAVVRALVRRRPDLLPRDLGAAPLPPRPLASAVVGLLAALLTVLPGRTVHAQDYAGLDDAVIKKAARDAGRLRGEEPEPPPEIMLFRFGLLAFVAGVVVGAGWMKLTRSEGHGHVSRG